MIAKTGIVLTLLAVMMFAATEALAAGPVDVKAELGVQSKYVFRGYLLSDGPVVQPSVTVKLKGLSLGLWGNMDLSDESDFDTKKTGEMNEVRATLRYNRSFVLLNVSAGVIHYMYPYKAYESATTEIFVHAGGTVPGHPAVTIYKDVDEAEGLYGEITASQTIPIGLLFGLEISGGLGLGSKEYNKFYFKKKDFTLTDVRVDLGVPIGIGELVKIRPGVTYTGILNSDIRDTLDAKDINDQNVYFGITASVSF